MLIRNSTPTRRQLTAIAAVLALLGTALLIWQGSVRGGGKETAGKFTEELVREGVPPDIEVEQSPAVVLAGRDPQLEKAIEIVLKELEKNPPAKPERAPYPIRVRKSLSPLLAGTPAMAQERTIMPDLRALADGKGGTIPADATLKWVEDAKGKPALKIQAKEGTVILLDRIEFTNGVIEFDALGQSGPPQSNFLGFAFRVVDAKTHDEVYFRPFNFRAKEAERRAHAVQYASLPKYPWHVLRKDKPGQYEKAIVPAPDGDAWFHVRIVVEKPKVSVYVNDGKEPSLVVEELSDRKGGGVGLKVTSGQGGYFANLKITPAK